MTKSQPEPFRIAFIPANVPGVVYWRIWNFAQALRRIPGVEVAVFCWQSEGNNIHPWQTDCYTNKRIRVEIEDLIRCADISVFQTVYTPMALSIIEAVKAAHKKPVLMEIDDDVLNIPTYNEGYKTYYPGSDREGLALAQMRASDGIITTTPYLKRIYEPYNTDIRIIPNSIDFKAWKREDKAKSDTLRIGWIGGGTHADDIAMAWPAVEQVLDKYRAKGLNVKFHCVHGVPNFLKDDKYKDKVSWTHDWAEILDYPAFMDSFKFDIGIAPLLENSFNTGKSNLRWLEYSALGIPAVCSNIGHYTDTIEHGKTGFLADSEGEWMEYLSRLVESPDLRREMGQSAYMAVKDRFDVEQTAKTYLETLKEYVTAHKQVKVPL